MSFIFSQGNLEKMKKVRNFIFSQGNLEKNEKKSGISFSGIFRKNEKKSWNSLEFQKVAS